MREIGSTISNCGWAGSEDSGKAVTLPNFPLYLLLQEVSECPRSFFSAYCFPGMALQSRLLGAPPSSQPAKRIPGAVGGKVLKPRRPVSACGFFDIFGNSLLALPVST